MPSHTDSPSMRGDRLLVGPGGDARAPRAVSSTHQAGRVDRPLPTAPGGHVDYYSRESAAHREI